MKHTQEPWGLRHTAQRNLHDIYAAGRPDTLATTAFHGWKSDESEANAHRIVACVNSCADFQNPAAIPDVVEACKELLYTAENADETGYVTDHGFIDMDALFLKVRTALAKLEGGE